MKFLMQNSLILSLVLILVECAGRNPTTMKPYGNRIETGECLDKKKFIESSNNCYKLIMQEDGNIVLYRNKNGNALWHTSTYDTDTSKFCLSEKGKLVAYDDDGNEKWQRSYNNNPDGTYALLKDNGNFVLYKPNDDIIWQAESSGDSDC